MIDIEWLKKLFRNILRIEGDISGEWMFVIFNDFYMRHLWYNKFKKIDRCFRRWKKVCKDPKLETEWNKPEINEALEAVQKSYDEGIGYLYKFDEEDLAEFIYPKAKRDLLVNAKLVYFSKQDSRDIEFLKENIIEIYNEKNKYLSRITLLYNYIIRIKDELYGDIYNEVINSNTRFTFQLIWLTQKTLHPQDYKRILKKVFKNTSQSEQKLIKMFLESRIGKYKDNPRFLKARDLDSEKREIAKELIEEIWTKHGR